jgi:hypothetical protein
MPMKRRTSKQRFMIRSETEAYILGEPWPEGTSGMTKFWHRHSLWTGHRGGYGYSVADACEALGVDVEAVRRRYGVSERYRGEAATQLERTITASQERWEPGQGASGHDLGLKRSGAPFPSSFGYGHPG